MTSLPEAPLGGAELPSEDVQYPAAIPFILVHVACLGAIWTGVHWRDVAIAVGLYLLRIFAIGAGYHRYFSHRAYKTSRVFQFILAFLAETTAQRGALWWAAKHRHHHRWSDTENDVHSPVTRSFFFAHVGWIFTPRHDKTDYAAVPDLAKYPELVWLNRHYYVPAIIMASLVWLFAGWSGLVVGFFWSTVALYHATFCINSLAHVHGRKRYLTSDESRNNWFLAILTMGEGWHNNHHAYQSSARQGFRWYEYDPTYYVLKMLSWVGVVWDLHEPPKAVIRNEQRLGTKVIEHAAAQLVAGFQVDRMAAQVREALAHTPTLNEVQEAWASARRKAETMLADLHLPVIPSVEELHRRAASMFVRTPSLDDIAARARQMLIEAVCARLAESAPSR